ncbi:MAG: CBS domain-containing protein [Coprobacillus sp.]|nr:CBS domain-containing protein [Coprobacillus sp.]
MNILFYLTPKKDVAYVVENYSIRQTLEKMEFHGYQSIPLLSEDGRYLSSISEGDLLWFLKAHDLNLKEVEQLPITEITPRREVKSLKIDATAEELYELVGIQNYVPVVDDRETFIGIVTRQSVINKIGDNIDIKKLFGE